MAGLILPLNLDTSGFNKALNDAEKKIGSMTAFLNRATSESVSITSQLNSGFEHANAKARTLVGTAQQLRDAMSSIENLSGAINLKTADGQKQIMKQYDEWSKIRTTLGDVNISFERLYKMQQEYQRLTGKEYKMTTLSDASNLPKLIEQEKELLRLIDEEEKQRIKAQENAAAAAKKAYEEENVFLKQKLAAEKQVEETRIKARSRESKQAYEEYFKKQDAILKAQQEAQANEIAASSLNMKARTVKEYVDKIKSMEDAQKKLDVSNDSGKRKFNELSNEIKKNKRELENLNNTKQKTIEAADKLAKRFAVLFSLNKIKDFAMNIVRIGGELEKQRVALGSIVGEISKANILFSQLKTQALESPFSFKDLIASTRQLAAFNIEYEKLYDTQFMLSELSAGLGVDVSRLILAYGQVRAAAVLRGQELRQFTEAGIPIIDALAKKFSELEGRVVSTGEVFEKVSERLVPFKMVDEVLRDMTEEGGKFYKMQEKQAETIYGQWVNLQDAMDMMRLDIAQEEQGVIMGTIKLLQQLITNWRAVFTWIQLMGVAYLGYAAISYSVQNKLIAASKAESAAWMTKAKVIGLAKTAMIGFIGVAVAGLIALGSHIIEKSREMDRFRKSMDDINQRHAADSRTSASELKRYIEQLKNAQKGSDEYRKIKEKIKNQYQDFLPILINENTTIEEIANSYEYATSSMKAYYAEKALEETRAKLNEDRGIKKRRDELTDRTKNVLESFGISDENVSRILPIFIDQIDELLLKGEDVGNVFERISGVAAEMGVSIGSAFSTEGLNTRGVKYNFIEGLKQSIEVPFNDYVSSIRDKTGIMANSTKSFFGEYAIIIEESLNMINEKYQEASRKISENTTLIESEKDFLKLDLGVAKTNAEIAAREMNKMISALASKGKELDAKGRKTISDFIVGVLNGGVKDSEKALIEGIAGTDEALQSLVGTFYNSVVGKIEENKQRQGNWVQNQNEAFFRKQSALLNAQYQTANKQNKEELQNLKTKQDALATVKNIVSEYVSLAEMQTLLNNKENIQEELRQNRNLKLSKTATEESKKTAKQKEKELNIQLEYINELIRLYNIQPKPTKKEEDPTIERARKLVSIYKELNQAYEKYIEYKNDDFSTTQSILELQEDYNSLNKEMGGILPQISAIKSQKELVDALEKMLKSGVFKTDKSRGIIAKALLGERAGQMSDDVKNEFEKLKKEAENLLDNVVIGVNEHEIAYKVFGIIEEMKRIAGAGEGATAIKEFISGLILKVDDNSFKGIIKSLDKRVEDLKDRYSASEELTNISKTLSLVMPEFLSQGTVTYEQYLQNLQDLADEYRAAGGEGIEKAAELEKDIQKTKFDYIKKLYMESFQIQQELLTTDEKIVSAEKQMSDIAVRISELNKLIVDAATDDENIERYKAELALLEQLMKKIGMQLEDLRSESFRVGEMYKMIYGDIEQYGRDVYESMLRQMKNILEESKKAGKKTIDGKDYYEVTYNYKDKSGEIIKKTEVLTAKELGDAITSIEKSQRKIRESSPWKKISEDIKKVKGNIVDLKDGSEKTIINFDSLGEAVSGIGDEISKLKELGEVLGLDESTTDYIEGIGGGVSAIGKLIATGGADIGSWVQLIKSWIQIFDADNNRRIREYGKEVEKLEKSFDNIQKSLADIADIDEQNAAITRSIRQLKDIEQKYRQMAAEEEAKKGTDKDAVEDYTKKAEEAAERWKDTLKSIAEEWSVTLSDAATTFANNWISAFEEVGSGISSLEKSFDDLLRNLIAKQIAEAIMKPMLDPIIKLIQESVKPAEGVLPEDNTPRGRNGRVVPEDKLDKTGGTKITDEEWEAILDLIDETLSGDYSYIDKILERLGLKSKENQFEYDTLQKGIQGITENTAQIIASYMNSVRVEVVTIRTLLEKQYGKASSQSEMNPMIDVRDAILNYYPQYLDNLIAIREHTSYLKDSYDPAKRALRMA